MDIRNRMADVVKLRCNACQDFLKLIIKSGWQQDLYNKAFDEVNNNGRYKDKYIATYEKMRDIGINNYGIEDMDVTFISEVLHGCPHIALADKRVKDAMKRLTEDRNLTNHSSENEPAEELYLRGLLSLCNLRNFVRTVDKFETSLDDCIRLSYRSKYIKLIDDLKEILDDERIELVCKTKEIKKDIQKILSSPDPLKTWVEISKIYMDKYWILEKDYDRYNEFMVRASDAGIAQAHSGAANYFLIIEKDYEEAEKRLLMMYNAQEHLGVYEMKEIIDLINTYLLRGNTITDGMNKIVDAIVGQGYNIQRTNEGVLQWIKTK